MLGALINRLWPTGSVLRDGDSLLLTQTEFNREVVRERVRATRRLIPFCVVTIRLLGGKDLRGRRSALIRLLHRNVRLTDQKGCLSGHRFAVLLVDTPEMGGRAVLDRLSGLCESRNLQVDLSLSVHDPDGFSDGDDGLPTGDGRRRLGDQVGEKWVRIDEVSKKPVVTRSWMVGDDPIDVTARLSPAGMVKRAVDILGATIGLVVLSPVLLAAMLAIKWTSAGPAIFRQTREGRDGKPFTIFKLRTMVVDAEQRQAALRAHSHRDGPAFKLDRDPRVTPVGEFLRKTCIDELPQLINVLLGDMSLVGPRPLPWHESRACEQWHRRRLDIRPGMTCHWQVNKAAAKTFDDWMRMDLRYVDRHGFWQDAGLIFRTVLVPLSGRGSE
ncbi:MAG: sugar transferase [Planctomycetota bacterium]